jgi:hypothetical protein
VGAFDEPFEGLATAEIGRDVEEVRDVVAVVERVVLEDGRELQHVHSEAREVVESLLERLLERGKDVVATLVRAENFNLEVPL